MNATAQPARVRRASASDASAIAAIYGYYVKNTVITFEIDPPTDDDMAGRIREVTESYPWLVAVNNDSVVGYAYVSRFKERAAYRYTAETSVYVDPGLAGRGIGSMLLGRLLDEVQTTPIAVLVAGIALPNDPSVRLHERFGFRPIAHFAHVGYKLGRWVDVGYWELEIRDVGAYVPETKPRSSPCRQPYSL